MRLLRSPGATLLVLGLLLGLIAFVVVKATWTPVAPSRIARRRSWGQVLSSSGRMYAKRPTLFVGLGLLLIPIALVTTGIQWLLVTGLDALGSVTGDLAGLFAYIALLVGTTLTLLGLGLVQAATACALVELDAGRSVGPSARTGSRSAASGRCSGRSRSSWLRGSSSPRPWSCFPSRSGWSSAGLSSLPSSSSSSDRGLPRSVAARSSCGGAGCGSARSWASAALIALAAGPLLGALLIFASSSSLAVLNVVAGVVYTIALPFVALVTAYVYFDARAREELEPRDVRSELPAEITLGGQLPV